MPTISPNLWFDTEAEQAAEFYTSVFPDSRIVEVLRYGPNAPRPEGTVLTVTFELDGLTCVAINGGPEFQFNEAISLAIPCANQEEVDRYWSTLTAGGSEGPCGWLKDQFGLSWQVVPTRLHELMADSDRGRAERATAAMMQMRKLDIAELERAADAVPAG